MKQAKIELPEIKLIGLTARTSDAHEADPLKGKIFPIVQTYFHQTLFDKIPNRKTPGTTYCAYTEYENEGRTGYTYFIGEEVSEFERLPEQFSKLVISPQTYIKFTNGPGAMPNVRAEVWQTVSQMSPTELGGTRRYTTDFEIYDERAHDHENIVFDTYVSIE